MTVGRIFAGRCGPSASSFVNIARGASQSRTTSWSMSAPTRAPKLRIRVKSAENTSSDRTIYANTGRPKHTNLITGKPTSVLFCQLGWRKKNTKYKPSTTSKYFKRDLALLWKFLSRTFLIIVARSFVRVILLVEPQNPSIICSPSLGSDNDVRSLKMPSMGTDFGRMI